MRWDVSGEDEGKSVKGKAPPTRYSCNAAICDFHRPKPRKLQEGKAQRMGKICKAAQAFRGDGIGRRQYIPTMEQQKKITEKYKTISDEIALLKLKIERANDRLARILDEEDGE